jgi:ABC-2 type transport system permease protein
MLAVAGKELRQIVRDRRTLVILVVVPMFFLFLYGYALNFDIRHISLAVSDFDGSPESRALVADFERSTYFDIVDVARSGDRADRLIDTDGARVSLVIPPEFSRRLKEGGVADVQVVINGDNANTARTVAGYVDGVLRTAAGRAAAADGREAWTARVPLVRVEPRIWYNPELRSTVFLVPGLIAFISMITAVVSTALSIVREKESGTIEQVRMAPISTAAFVLGKTLPYLFLSFLGAMAIVVAAMALFDLPMRGHWVALAFVVAVFLVGALGTGLLVSTVADTQQVAFQAASLIALLPTVILSGFIFPISSMPVVLQYVTLVVPARYFLVALRGIVLKGLPLSEVLAPTAAMAAYAVAVLALSAVRLARR